MPSLLSSSLIAPFLFKYFHEELHCFHSSFRSYVFEHVTHSKHWLDGKLKVSPQLATGKQSRLVLKSSYLIVYVSSYL